MIQDYWNCFKNDEDHIAEITMNERTLKQNFPSTSGWLVSNKLADNSSNEGETSDGWFKVGKKGKVQPEKETTLSTTKVSAVNLMSEKDFPPLPSNSTSISKDAPNPDISMGSVGPRRGASGIEERDVSQSLLYRLCKALELEDPLLYIEVCLGAAEKVVVQSRVSKFIAAIEEYQALRTE